MSTKSNFLIDHPEIELGEPCRELLVLILNLLVFKELLRKSEGS
jgi:hypothetical protein